MKWLALFLVMIGTAQAADFRTEKLQRAVNVHQAAKPTGWDSIVTHVRALPSDLERFNYVHSLVNQLPYIDGTNGSYYAPIEALKRGGVVCKDYAVMKYLLLKDAGVSIAKMAILVHDSIGDSGGAHVVFEFKDGGLSWISNQWMKPQQERFRALLGVQKRPIHDINTLLKTVKVAETIDAPVTFAKYQYRNKKIFQRFNEISSIYT